MGIRFHRRRGNGRRGKLDEALLLLLRDGGRPGKCLGSAVGARRYLRLIGQKHSALVVLGAVVGGQICSTLLKMGFDRARPDLVPHAVHVYTASFPSGHAMMSAVTYLTLGALLARVHTGMAVKSYVLSVALILTLLVGVSRLYLGVHWPTDVAAGWAVGAAWALVSSLVMRRLQKRGEVEAPAPARGVGSAQL